jgi:hypothetical protein
MSFNGQVQQRLTLQKDQSQIVSILIEPGPGRSLKELIVSVPVPGETDMSPRICASRPGASGAGLTALERR